MCRHLAYVGPETSLHELLWRPSHALVEQAAAPNDMRGGGTVNADGFGVGWFASGSEQPSRYRNDRPMWTDVSFAEVAGQTRASAMLGAVRSATPGMPVMTTACAPFTDGQWLFSHNGVVRGWPESLAPLAEKLPVADLMTAEAPTDSAVLWALLRRRLGDGSDPVVAVGDIAEQVMARAPGSRMNLLLTDGNTVIATACRHALSVRGEADAVTVASEPFGTGGWKPVPEDHVLVADRQHVRTASLAISSGPATAGPAPTNAYNRGNRPHPERERGPGQDRNEGAA